MNLVTKKQAQALCSLGYNEYTKLAYTFDIGDPILAPTVDEVIDWLRKKYRIMIYSCEPYVSQFLDKNTIMYGFKVKQCNMKWGWNQREYISTAMWSKNIYAAKRMAIWKAIRFIQNKEKSVKLRRHRSNRTEKVRGSKKQ